VKQNGSPACGPKQDRIPAWPGTGADEPDDRLHWVFAEEFGGAEQSPRSHAKMNVRIASIQEEIQQRIASDLHDATCQHLIAASLSVMRMRASLDDRAGAEKLCDDIDALIDQALKEIRTFAYLLHPQNLTADGLKTTIEQYAGGFAVRTSLRVTTKISSEVDRLPYRKQCSLLRVIQEALTNVFRHAQATEVEVALEPAGNQFQLRITDNGRGMAGGRARCGAGETSLGVGIPAMRARLQQLGGVLEIQSAPQQRGRGTTLSALFPYRLANEQRSRQNDVVVNKGSHKRATK